MEIFAEYEKREEILNLWQKIRVAMNAHYITPQQLAMATNKSASLINRGISGEPIDIDLFFLNRFVKALGYGSGRTGNGLDYSWDECVKFITPKPAMPPLPGNIWDNNDFDLD